MIFPFERIEQFLRTSEGAMAACGVKGDSVGRFWDWLGRVKYKEDGGNLTVERAAEIIKKMPDLVREWRESF